MRYHAHLCLENVPLQAWGEEEIGKILATLQKTDASLVSLWAWTTDPSTIPKVMWSTILDRPGQQPIGSATPAAPGLDGLQDRVLIHLDILEDFSPDAAGNIPRNARRQDFDWDKGNVDGERQPRESQSSLAARGRCNRRDDDDHEGRDDDDHEDRNGRRDDDNDRRGRQDARDQSWAGRLFRSRSRTTGSRRDDGGRRDDQRRRDDRRGERYDGRLRQEAAAPLAPLVGLEAAEDAHVVTPVAATERGRAATRHPSPRAERNRSTDNLTPQASPPSSPTSMLPSRPSSKRADDRAAASEAALMIRVATSSPLVTSLCSPACLELPSPQLSRPPGFVASPTPPFVSDSTPARTPPPVARTPAAPPAMEDLFAVRMPPLLPSPVSSPVQAPTRRRKTMAGMTISSQGGRFSLWRSSARIKGKKVGFATSMAKEAQGLVCRSIGIIRDGEDVTARALDQFEQQFKDQLPDSVIAALRGLFKIDDAHAASVEEALIGHGGAEALDHEEESATSA